MSSSDAAGRKTYLEGWRLYPLSMAGHHVQGAAAGAGAITGSPGLVATAALWTALYVAYQGLSVLRKADSPGLDIADYLAGFGAGVAGALVIAHF